MSGLTSTEAAVLERAAAEPMLASVEEWAAINSGSSNLAGLAQLAVRLADAFSPLPGDLNLRKAASAEVVLPDGALEEQPHGDNLHLVVRPEAPVQLLLTGHMDTVFAADHPFQRISRKEQGVIGGPGSPT